MENLNGFNNGRDLTDGVGGQSEEKDKKIEEFKSKLVSEYESKKSETWQDLSLIIEEAIEYGESLARGRAVKAVGEEIAKLYDKADTWTSGDAAAEIRQSSYTKIEGLKIIKDKL